MRLPPLLAAVVLPAGAAFAQPVTDVAQVSDGKASVRVEPLPIKVSNEAPAQISHSTDRTPAEAQLTNPSAAHQQTTQLSSGPRTARPPQPLSRPADGRTAAVERVAGSDSCDPAVPKEKQSQACKQVIESRADDYTRPHPTELTPEQRLLLDQELEHAGEGVADATRRLATTGETDNSDEAMGIAAIVLRQSGPPSKEPEEPDDPAAKAAVEAIVQIMTQAPPN
jgi:hypothetical protein